MNTLDITSSITVIIIFFIAAAKLHRNAHRCVYLTNIKNNRRAASEKSLIFAPDI